MEGDVHIFSASAAVVISIHALRVEGDKKLERDFAFENISIHALRVEGDSLGRYIIAEETLQFQSTPSVWRATSHAAA